jgi:hypothetical protein
MAQAGYTPIQLYYSSTTGAAPTAGGLLVGELGVNVTDLRVYTKNASNAVVELGTNPSTITTTQVDLLAQGDLRFQDAAGGQYAAIQAPATISSSYTLTLPTTDGDANQVLTTDGSGVLSWSTPSSGVSKGQSIAFALIFGL